MRPVLVLRTIYYLTALGLLATGLGFLLGPASWTASPSYEVARSMADIDTWSWAFIAAGVAKLFLGHGSERHYRVGSAIGGGVALAWCGSFVASAVIGELVAWSAITSWSIVATVQLAGAAGTWRR